MRIQIAQRADADELLGSNPFALLTGMLLDQQVAMEWAFTGPFTIAKRLGGELSPDEIADRDPEEFAALLAQKPAVHRYPSSMAKRVQQLAAYLVEHYDGDAAALWRDVPDGKELLRRLNDLPGFGKQKAQIFLALLGKQFGITPEGWREAAGPYGEEGSHRSVADVVDDDSLARVRAAKQAAKQAAKRAAEPG
ncbi:Fe-S cluster assembly protein HesB [Spongiactinospora rosea]|uniref:Fe-S cluster assembly protein HesB n=1 Tax=Spongiactinospora rosea TaxID=2248750 RepID=A0A366M2E6_9ACTN|nr:HhH-GPD-type base excision DNA repair protein [Spongiactinospora rosea]RBQ19764.1 Fe-S cluster assembly protein HesB [Spongiactinospora rosea]